MSLEREIDLGKYELRTDLAIDHISDNVTIPGIKSTTYLDEDIKVTTVFVEEEGSKTIGKKKGNYITIEFSDVTDYTNREHVKKVFVEKLKELLKSCHIDDDQSCLVIGLGNERSTPDALGPLTVEQILVTNHLFSFHEIHDGFRKVFAFTPGVMGKTGIETSDMIKSITSSIHPDFLLVVDSLASQSVERVNKTIQMTNTGIHPGSGIGNTRKEISQEILGIPVIAIGVPTVVDAVTIVSDTIHYMYKHFSYTKANLHNPMNRLLTSSVNYLKKEVQVDVEEKKKLFGMVGSLEEEEVKKLIYEVLSPIGYNLMVTPKEVDFVVSKLSDVIGNGINRALHKNVDHL